MTLKILLFLVYRSQNISNKQNLSVYRKQVEYSDAIKIHYLSTFHQKESPDVLSYIHKHIVLFI